MSRVENEMNYSHSLLVGRVHWAPQLGLVYLNNSKVACSTVKKSLWIAVDRETGIDTYAGSPHDRRKAPFSKNIRDLKRDDQFSKFLESTFFSVVRNPYVRILSSYLNKVRKGSGDRSFWEKFTIHFNLPEDADLSFLDFLELIETEDPVLLDWHLCPQTVNLLYPIAPIDFLGRLEEMDQCASWLEDRGVQLQSHTPHQTNAQEQVREFYRNKERKIVLRYFEKDFELYGYDENPLNVHPIRPPILDDARSRIYDFLLPEGKSGP